MRRRSGRASYRSTRIRNCRGSRRCTTPTTRPPTPTSSSPSHRRPHERIAPVTEEALRIVMLTYSYPLFAGDMTAPFIEEIAAGIATRGHTVHVVLPDHPRLRPAGIYRGV